MRNVLGCVLIAFAWSCAGKNNAVEATPGIADAAQDTTLPQVCSHLTDKADAATCSVGRALLMCTDEAGDSGMCVTDATACPGPGAVPGDVCHNACDATEYGLACHFSEPVSPGCRLMAGPIPGGSTFYCCKCTDP